MILQGNVRHNSSAEVYRELGSDDIISTGSALAIASWWQAPGGHGLTFAAFASGRPVDSEQLREAVTYELGVLNAGDRLITGGEEESIGELEALDEWIVAQVV